MLTRRTDLAIEEKEIWSESADEQTELKGVEAREDNIEGFITTVVKILDEQGEQALGKPRGTYITVELDSIIKRDHDAFEKGMDVISQKLSGLLDLSDTEHILVVGLGNYAVTPDRIGPLTAKNTMVTRHLVEQVPEHFGAFRSVSVLEPGVLGTTGIESAKIIKAVVSEIKPNKVVAIDALASRNISRICRTVQICDTGIVPGSGVGNSREAINADTLGIPVISVGIPTVVNAGTLAADLIEKTGLGAPDPNRFGDVGGTMIVTPKEIDVQVTDLSKLLGYSLNKAFHEGITLGDIDMFLS